MEAMTDPSRLAFVRLTDPDGFLLSNEVIASIFSALPGGEHSQHGPCAALDSSADKSSLKPQ